MFKKFIKWLSRDISSNQDRVYESSNRLDDNYLFDFKNWASEYNYMASGPVISGSESVKKISIKPIDALQELETVPTPFTLALLDEKIEILKQKEELIVQMYARKEVNQLIFRLENRKKYLKFKDFFDSFQNTTDEKIDMLLDKYDLVMKSSDIFVPEFPDIAISIMQKYSDRMVELCGKKPVFYVIATEKDFHTNYDKRDPILLVQSPFGFYWQILGAWDKEMLLLSEL